MYTNMVAGIVTCTFLRGGMDDGVAYMVEQRLVDIARANPWLCGHLTTGSPTHTFHYPDAETAARTVISRCLTYGGSCIDHVFEKFEFMDKEGLLERYLSIFAAELSEDERQQMVSIHRERRNRAETTANARA